MEIKTQRLQIRPIEKRDWQAVREIWLDFQKSPYVRFDRPHNVDPLDVQELMDRWEKAWSREHMFFAVCLKGQVIGYVAFNGRTDSHELGYCFHSRYAGLGYAKESHLALFDYMRSLGIRKLTAGTALQNLPSVGLLRSLGFWQAGEETLSFYEDAEGKPIFFQGGLFVLAL